MIKEIDAVSLIGRDVRNQLGAERLELSARKLQGRHQKALALAFAAPMSAEDKERFANCEAERYWHLRERFLRGEISGLRDEELGELASIGYVIDPRGKTAIEDKASVKSTLGRSPDHAESLMLALGEPSYEPFRFTPLLRHVPKSSPFAPPQQPAATCKAQDDADDMAGKVGDHFP